MRSTATTSASACRRSRRSRGSDAPAALARATAHGGRAVAARRARAGGLAASDPPPRRPGARRASRRRRPTPSPSSRRSRPARRSGSSSVSCTRATSSSRSTSASPAASCTTRCGSSSAAWPPSCASPRLRPEHLPAAFDLLDRCIDSAIAKQSYEDDDVAWEALRRELRRNLRTVVRVEADRLDEFVPRHFEISLPASGVRVGGVPITGRIDRVDEREWVAEALIWDYKSGQVGALGPNVLEKGRLQLPLYIRAAAELLGRDVVGRPLPVGQGRRGPARHAARGRARGRCAGGLRQPRLRRARGCSSSCWTRPVSERAASSPAA